MPWEGKIRAHFSKFLPLLLHQNQGFCLKTCWNFSKINPNDHFFPWRIWVIVFRSVSLQQMKIFGCHSCATWIFETVNKQENKESYLSSCHSCISCWNWFTRITCEYIITKTCVQIFINIGIKIRAQHTFTFYFSFGDEITGQPCI